MTAYLTSPHPQTWRLNERHYGALQGLNKKETVEKHGDEQVRNLTISPGRVLLFRIVSSVYSLRV